MVQIRTQRPPLKEPFSKQSWEERQRLVIVAIKELNKSQMLVTLSAVKNHMNLRFATDKRYLQRTVKQLVHIGVLEEVKEEICLRCGRTLRKYPHYKFTYLIPTEPPIEPDLGQSYW